MIARIWKVRNPLEFAELVNNYNGLAIYAIPGYHIALAFGTTLTGKLPYEPGIKEIITRTLEAMGDFYLKEKVLDKPGYFRRYRVNLQ